MVAHTFNPNTQEAEDLCEFETNLVYRENSRTGSKATQRNSASKYQKTF